MKKDVRFTYTNNKKPVEWENGVQEPSKISEESKIIKFPTRRKISSYYIKSDGNDKVPLPEESVGHCKNYRKCKQYNVVLGNDLCMDCWDKKTGSKGYGATST